MQAPTGLRYCGLALVLALGLTGLAACSDDDPKPGHLQSPTSPSTTSSPSPTTPEAQVEAAVRTYYDELVRGIRTANPDKVRTLVTKGCPCYGAVEAIQANAAKNRTGPDVKINIKELRVHDVERTTAAAEVRYDVNAYPLLDRNGDVVSRIPARSDFVDLSLVKVGSSRWVIGNVFNLES